MPQPVRHTAVGQATRTVLIALRVTVGFVAGTVLLVVVAAYGAAKFKAGPQPAQPASTPTQSAIPSVAAPSAAVAPSLPSPSRGRQASAQRASDGYYYFDTAVGGTTVRMLFDTGASTVALRAEDAERVGIAVNSLNYNIRSQTANGTTEVALVTLASLRVGDVTRWNVLAVVSKPGKLHVSLLGQSFMSKLAGYRFEWGELILQGD